jgi:hypothetical protein
MGDVAKRVASIQGERGKTRGHSGAWEMGGRKQEAQAKGQENVKTTGVKREEGRRVCRLGLTDFEARRREVRSL